LRLVAHELVPLVVDREDRGNGGVSRLIRDELHLSRRVDVGGAGVGGTQIDSDDGRVLPHGAQSSDRHRLCHLLEPRGNGGGRERSFRTPRTGEDRHVNARRYLESVGAGVREIFVENRSILSYEEWVEDFLR